MSTENGTSQPNTPRTRKKKGKQKWLPLPLEDETPNGDDESATVPNSNAENGDSRSASVKPSGTDAGAPVSKGARGARSTRGGRGGSRNRTRSLDGAAPKKTRKNRTAATVAAAAAASAAAYQQAYEPYQDYYAYYCKSTSIVERSIRFVSLIQTMINPIREAMPQPGITIRRANEERNRTDHSVSIRVSQPKME